MPARAAERTPDHPLVLIGGAVTGEGRLARPDSGLDVVLERELRRFEYKVEAGLEPSPFATARWLKHVVTFDNWLDYIARKVQRRTGMRIEITP